MISGYFDTVRQTQRESSHIQKTHVGVTQQLYPKLFCLRQHWTLIIRIAFWPTSQSIIAAWCICPGGLVPYLMIDNLSYFILRTLFSLSSTFQLHKVTTHQHSKLIRAMPYWDISSLLIALHLKNPDRRILQPHFTEGMVEALTGAQKGWSHHYHTAVQPRRHESKAGCLIPRMELLRGTFLCHSSVHITN